MDRKTKVAIIGTVTVVCVILIALGVSIVKTLTPSKETMPLSEYYPVEDSEVLIILQNKVYEKKGMLIDGEIYLDYETVAGKFNHRFYWDSNENILTYTTPDQILQAQADKKGYTITKSVVKTNASEEYPIVKVFADRVYIALDFVQKYSDLNFKFYENPNRVVINYIWQDYLYTEVKKDTQLRTEASIKKPILVQLKQGTGLMYVDVDETPKKGFAKVMTEDGIIGYVKNSFVKKSFYQSMTSTYQAPEYTAQTRPGKLNMVFHQVFDNNAADKLEDLIKSTKKVNVVVPTWFSISDESGKVTSFASSDYVEKANLLGLEVWALVDDFNSEVSKFELLSHTSSRENLENTLIEAAQKYKLNGINIDFEKITSDTGIHYIEFLRELSVKCRNNGIVLSVDSYVPSAWTTQYDREEQGKILDYVVVMAYDESTAEEEAGPNSSLPFVQEALDNILTMVPKEKVIMAIPFFTKVWQEAPTGELTYKDYAMTPAAQLLKDNDVEAKWDDANGCYYAKYELDGSTYQMWQEEDKSIEEKMKVIYNAGVAGVAEWKLGLEKESIWDVILRYLN